MIPDEIVEKMPDLLRTAIAVADTFRDELIAQCDAWLAQPAVTETCARAHPQVVSVVNRFALVAATLAMAIEAKILPWSKTDTDVAIIACMQRWVGQRGNQTSCPAEWLVNFTS